MKILIKGGKIIDPVSGMNQVADILIEAGKIKKIARNIRSKARTFDARGKLVSPGFIDLHTHLREPGGEGKETITSGTLAAAKGGFTAVCAMPNTDPPCDSVTGIKYLLTTSAQEGKIRVYPIGAITKGRKGEELTEIGTMSKAGMVAVSDDGTCVMDSLVMRRAMEYAKMFGIILISHCEDMNLSRNGMMNEGRISTMMGLRGIPHQAEEIIISRDIAIAELTGCRLHLAHVSTARSVELIKEAKKRKINVTAEVTPHHLTLTEEDVQGYNTNCKVNPPLRTHKDRKALISGLQKGHIDCIATDHAPHLDQEKYREFALAPFGINGLETAFAVLYGELVANKHLTVNQLIKNLTSEPARVLGLENTGRIEAGLDADLTVIDTDMEIDITAEFFSSKSMNSPYLGRKLKGFPVLTLYGGKIAWRNNAIYP